MKQLMESLLLVIITTGAPPHSVVAFSSLTQQQASYYVRPLANHPCRINTLTSCVNFSRSTSLLFANKEDESGSSLSHEIEHTSSSTNISGSIISDIIQKNDSNIISTQPPKFLSLGYKIASFTNIISGLLLLVSIPTIQSVAISSFSSSISSVDAATQLLSSSTRYQPNLLATYTAGTLGYLLLSGGVCNILSNATKAKVSNCTCRLYTSDTYKRLNKGILLFSIMGLFSIPGEAGCLLFSANNDNKMNMMFGIVAFITIQLTNLLTATTSFIGWEYSVAGGFGVSRKDRIKNMFNEVGKGLKNIYNNFPVTEQRPATFYRTFWIILSIGNLMFNIPELIFNIQQLFLGGVGTSSLFLPVSLTMSSIARLGLLSFILYVLKDAAERKRLEGTTFIKLNMMVGLWAVGGELYI